MLFFYPHFTTIRVCGRYTVTCWFVADFLIFIFYTRKTCWNRFVSNLGSGFVLSDRSLCGNGPSTLICFENPSTMNLMCTESQKVSEDKCFAEDRAIFRDERAVKKLLETEEQYVPGCDYLAHSHSNLQPFMRRVVATWMLDVSIKYNRIYSSTHTKLKGSDNR